MGTMESILRLRMISQWILFLIGLTLVHCIDRSGVQIQVPNKRIVCYYRVEENFRPYDIDPTLCTHLIYSYVVVKDNFAFVAGKKGDLKFLGSLKQQNPDLKVLVSLRPSGKEFPLDGSSGHNSTSINSVRSKLAKKVQEFVVRHGLDGVDLDWEFFRDPKETVTKKDNLIGVIQSLRSSLDQISSKSGGNYLVTITTSKYPRELAESYDFASLHKHLDFVNVPAFSFDSEGKTVRHPARLHGISDMENMDSLVDLILALGLPSDKLIMGIPSYGILYKLTNTSMNAPGSPAVAWKYNEAIISHAKICAVRDNKNWTMVREKDLTSPYIYNKDKWIGFDDEISLKLKAKYIVLRGLGGLALWAVNDDDPAGKCGYGPFPLLQVIKSVLVKPVIGINLAKTNTTTLNVLGTSTSSSSSSIGSGNTADSVASNELVLGTSFVAIVEKYGNVERVSNEEAGDEGFSCAVAGYKRHPKDCSMFYRCVKYEEKGDSMIKFQYRCPQGLLFDDTYEICNWPSWSPPCTGSGEIMPVTKKSFTCQSYGYFQDPDNCEYFYYCSDFGKGHFQGYEFKCPFDLAFDEEKLLCNWKWLVRGCRMTEVDASNTANLDAILQSFPSTFLSQAESSLNSMSKGLESMDDVMSRRSDESVSESVGDIHGDVKSQYVDGEYVAEHREGEPKTRRSFARALKDGVTDLVGSVTNKVKSLFNGHGPSERRDPMGGNSAAFAEWFAHMNPFGAASLDMPIRLEEPRKRPGRRPLIDTHEFIKDPLMGLPLLEIPTKLSGPSGSLPKEVNKPARDRRQKQGAHLRPKVHYADEEKNNNNNNKNNNNKNGDVNNNFDKRPLSGTIKFESENHRNPGMIAVPILTLKDQTIQRRPDTGMPSVNTNGRQNGRDNNQRDRSRPDSANHDPLSVASSVHLSEKSVPKFAQTTKIPGPIPIPFPKQPSSVNKEHHQQAHNRVKPEKVHFNHQSQRVHHHQQHPSSGLIVDDARVPMKDGHKINSNIINNNNQAQPSISRPIHHQQGPPQQGGHGDRRPVASRTTPIPLNQASGSKIDPLKQLPVDFFPGYEVDIKPLEIQEMIVNKGVANVPAYGNQPATQIILPNLREHVREHVRQHIQKIRNQQPGQNVNRPHQPQPHQPIPIPGGRGGPGPQIHYPQQQHPAGVGGRQPSPPLNRPSLPTVQVKPLSAEGSDSNVPLYSRPQNTITYVKSQTSDSYVGVQAQRPSHYGLHPGSSDQKRPSINAGSTGQANVPVPDGIATKNGFVPIQSQYASGSASSVSQNGEQHWPSGQKIANKPVLQAMGSSNEYQYYSQPMDTSIESHMGKILTSSSSIPLRAAVTTSRPKVTIKAGGTSTTKKSQLLIIPVPDSHPQAQSLEDIEKLAQSYPHLFPHGLDFKRIPNPSKSGSPTTSTTEKEEYVYVVMDDKKANGLKEAGIDITKEGTVSMEALMRNPEILATLASQQGIHFDFKDHRSSSQNVVNNNKKPSNVHTINQPIQPSRSPVFVKHDEKTESNQAILKNKKNSSRNKDQSRFQPATRRTTTVSPTTKRRTTRKPATSTTPMSPPTSPPVASTTYNTPSTTTSTTTTTTARPITSSSAPVTTVNHDSNDVNPDANDDSFFLGNQQIPQSLFESIQQVIAQHLMNSQVSGKQGQTNQQGGQKSSESNRSTSSSNVETTTESIRGRETTLSPNGLPGFQNYYYQPSTGSNDSIVFGQGWPSYPPNWYQYAFPQPIYPQNNMNISNPQYQFYPMMNGYMGHPSMNYQPQYLPNSPNSPNFIDYPYLPGSQSASSGSGDATLSPFMKYTTQPASVTPNPTFMMASDYDNHYTASVASSPVRTYSTVPDYQPSSSSMATSRSTSKKPLQPVWDGTEKPGEFLTEKPFDLLRTKQEPPQIQVYIVQGSNGPQVKTKTVNPNGGESPNVKVFVIDETKDQKASSSSKDDEDEAKLDSNHKPADSNNYYSFAYESRPRPTVAHPSSQSSSGQPMTTTASGGSGHQAHYYTTSPVPMVDDDGASNYDNINRDIEYEDDSFNGENPVTDSGYLPAAKISSLQSLYNTNLYPGLRNFTDGSVPEAACTRPGLFQHPNDCNKFYECYWDKFINKFTLHLFECPVKLAFDSRIVGCSAPSDPTVCVQY